MRKSIPPDQARDILLALPASPKIEIVDLLQAGGHVLAEDVTALTPIPPFDRSPYDGYAFRGEDTASATKDCPAVLRITEEVRVGEAPTMPVTHGTAAKILTGGVLPQGANAIVKYELTEFDDTQVKLFTPVAPETDVIRAGEDVTTGTVVARQGDVLRPPLLGLLASVGRAEVSVYVPPRAAILNTGGEIVLPGEPLPPAKVYNSSLFTLTGYLRAIGIDSYHAGTAPDDPAEIARQAEEALAQADFVITTGGASVGDYDCAIRAAQLMGAEILFWKASMKPGGAAAASVKNGKLILALSGNPGGAVLFLLRVALPYLKKLCGRRDCLPESMEVHLKRPFDKCSGRSRLLRGRLEISSGKAYFAEVGAQGSGAISSLAGADLLAELPAGSPPLPAGTLITAYRIEM